MQPIQGPSRLWGLLGLLVAVAIVYGTLVANPGQYTFQQAVGIGLAAIAIGGFISRRGKRGALLGFFLPFLPLLILGLIFLSAGLTAGGDGGSGDGIGALAEAFGQAIGTVVIIALGVALIIASFIAGFVGAIVGGLAGWISGKLFPPRTPGHPPTMGP
jgi:hypothetical protein